MSKLTLYFCSDVTEKMLSYDKMYLIVGSHAVQDLIMEIDVEFFNSVLKVLISDVLKPIPSSVTQAIRDFAKRMEGWVKESMAKMPRRLLQLKVSNTLLEVTTNNKSSSIVLILF